MAGFGFLTKGGNWFRSLPKTALFGVGVEIAGLFEAGSLMAYRTYDYIEHDNDFCMSCHLMAEPYELFGQSAHRDLGCKACHQPSFAGRSEMALTQVLESPDTITAHAAVPNEKCVSCHVEGDPDEWVLIANSAGHRLHMESEDPELDGLQCVQCHSSSIHEFAATDQTCAQSGCHEDVEITLGSMGNFTIHCAACHGFNSVVPEEAGLEVAQAAVAPTGDECLSCHVMRTLVEMPPDEPHDQVCSTCHNPHEQVTPEQAVETCATVGCHNDMRELSPFHRGLDHTDVENCGSCHAAHDWTADGNDCLSCHQDIYDDAPPAPGRVVALGGAQGDVEGRSSPDRNPAAVGAGLAAFHGLGGSTDPADWIHTVASHPPVSNARPGPPPVPAQEVGPAQEAQEPQTSRRPFLSTGEAVFRHGNHRDVDCVGCHDSTDEHGAITLESLADCRSCHHEAPVANDCAACHAPSVLGPEPVVAESWPMNFSTGDAVLRDVPFLHGDHEDADCAQCHASEPAQTPQVANCNDCHQEHHQPPEAVDCATCHEVPDEGSHTVQSHLGCTGSGCHLDPPLPVAPRNRSGCLSCHRDLADHRPEGECVECHALPAPRGASGP